MTSLPPEIKSTLDSLRYRAIGPFQTDLTLICIPGFACRAADYERLFQTLSHHNSEIKAYTIDFPGHGDAPISKTLLKPSSTVSTYADLLNSFIHEKQIPRPVLVGHSMGCRVAIETWRRASPAGRERFAGIIFLDGSHYRLRGMTAAFDESDPRSQGLSVAEKRELMVQMFEGMCSDATPVEERDAIIQHVRGMDFELIVCERKGLLDYDVGELDAALEVFGREGKACPLLNLQSTAVNEQNQRVLLRNGEISGWMTFLKKVVPHAQVDVVEGASHFPHIDQPEIVREKMMHFLNDSQ